MVNKKLAKRRGRKQQYVRVVEETHEQKLQGLKDAGIDGNQLAMNISIVNLLADILEGRVGNMVEMLSKVKAYKFQNNLKMNAILRDCKAFREESSRMFTDGAHDLFGRQSDFLNDLICDARMIKDEEDQLKLLSMVKLLSKTKE